MTLPLDQLTPFKSSDATWLIQPMTAFVLQNANPKRNYITVDMARPFNTFWRLISEIQKRQFDEVYFFFGPWWLAFLFFLLRIPVRVGRKSQWYSFLFFNFSDRQKRHFGKKHESLFGKDLVGLKYPEVQNETLPFLSLQAPQKRQLFEKFQIYPGDYFIVHPGMAGSALNWPTANYQQLIQKLSMASQVIVTGTAADENYLAPLKADPQLSSNSKVIFLDGHLKSEEFLYFLKNAKGVFAPSTGTLHLASSLGARTLGIYSPVATQKSERWGPRGPQVKTLTPQVKCPAAFSCWKEKCPLYNCLAQISVDEVIGNL